MKKLILILQLALFSTVLLAQNGTYRCNSQRFQDKNNSSNNKDHTNAMIITVDVNDYTGGFVLISCPSLDVSYKYDILKKLGTKVNSETKSVYTFYEARFNVANVQAPITFVVGFIQDPNKNSFHITVDNTDGGIVTLYQNLTKITY
jgi:hypothetical protein